ncbi:DNA translocase FtsK [Mycobacterium tuberculosis]|nr:DNA translocase FtsK [Mycobacterium tuberculosis]
MRAVWMMAAKGTGGAARSIGRARDIEPGHRRDGIALVLLGLAVVVAASSWFDAARPLGAWVDALLRTFIGSAVVMLPLVAAAVAVVLMRTSPNPDSRPRLILGASLIGLSFLGLCHLWAGSPEAPESRLRAAGFIGFAIGGPLSDGLTAWIAAPLLFIGALFGLLLLAGITIREVPDAMRAMFGTRLLPREYADDFEDFADFDGDDADTVEVPARTSPTVTTTRCPCAPTTGHRPGRRPRFRRMTLRRYRKPPPVGAPEDAAAAKIPKCWTGSSRVPTRCRRWTC